jgi:hypothetical protein
MQYNQALALIMGALGTGSLFATIKSRDDYPGVVLSGVGSTLATAVVAVMAWKNANPWIVLGVLGAIVIGMIILSLLTPPRDMSGSGLQDKAFERRAVTLSLALEKGRTIQEGMAILKRVAPDVTVTMRTMETTEDFWAANVGPAVVFRGTSPTQVFVEYDIGLDSNYVTVTR